MEKSIQQVIGASILAGIMSVPVASQAVELDRITDELTFSGAKCNFADAGAGDDAQRTPLKFQNSSGSTKEVVCPISRKRYISRAAAVSALTSNTVSPTSCKFRIRNFYDGTQQALDYTGTLNRAGNQQVLWTYGQPGYYVDINSALGISCDLPHGASVLLYHYDSQDAYHGFNF